MENNVIWSPGISLDALEKMVIRKAYRFYHQNKVATANALKIAVRTLDNRLERYDQEDATYEQQAIDTRDRRREHLLRARGFAPDQLAGQARQTTAEPVLEPALDVSETQAVPVSEQQTVPGLLPENTATVSRKRNSRSPE
jgi:hypothetical protein